MFGTAGEITEKLREHCTARADIPWGPIQCQRLIRQLTGRGEDPKQIVRALANTLLYIPFGSMLSPPWFCIPERGECAPEVAKMHAMAALLLSTMGQHHIVKSVTAFTIALERYGLDAREEETLINSLRGILISIPELSKRGIDGKLIHPEVAARAILAVQIAADPRSPLAVQQFAQEILPKLPDVTISVPPLEKPKFPTGPVVFAFGLIAAIGALIFYADSIRD